MSDFEVECFIRSSRRNILWYKERMMAVLDNAKEKDAKDVDKSIALTKQFLEELDKKRVVPKEVVIKEFVSDALPYAMKPVDPETRKILTEGNKGYTAEYMKKRSKIAPEDKFYCREASSYDYGWHQKHSRMKRDCFHGRVRLLAETFYRKNNVKPDPEDYKDPAGYTGFCAKCA